MKKYIYIAIILQLAISAYAQEQQRPINKPDQQQNDPNRMTPGMTEIMDPEVPIIQPGIRYGDPPSDAIVLFNGTDINT